MHVKRVIRNVRIPTMKEVFDFSHFSHTLGLSFQMKGNWHAMPSNSLCACCTALIECTPTIPSALDRTEIRAVVKPWKQFHTSRSSSNLMKPSRKVSWLILKLFLRFYRNRRESWGLALLLSHDHRANHCSFYWRWNGRWPQSKLYNRRMWRLTDIACRFPFTRKDNPGVCEKWEESKISFMVGIRTFRMTLILSPPVLWVK